MRSYEDLTCPKCGNDDIELVTLTDEVEDTCLYVLHCGTCGRSRHSVKLYGTGTLACNRALSLLVDTWGEEVDG